MSIALVLSRLGVVDLSAFFYGEMPLFLSGETDCLFVLLPCSLSLFGGLDLSLDLLSFNDGLYLRALSSSSIESLEFNRLMNLPAFDITGGPFTGFCGKGCAVILGGSRVIESFKLSSGSYIEIYLSLGEAPIVGPLPDC